MAPPFVAVRAAVGMEIPVKLRDALAVRVID
jgi:hypothetical protein